MENLINILKNKRVVLVGPAPYLNDKKRGKIIESYDIVCGVGSTYNLNSEDYGNRIDILGHRGNFFQIFFAIAKLFVPFRALNLSHDIEFFLLESRRMLT